jgi:hypothetical protein
LEIIIIIIIIIIITLWYLLSANVGILIPIDTLQVFAAILWCYYVLLSHFISTEMT